MVGPGAGASKHHAGAKMRERETNRGEANERESQGQRRPAVIDTRHGRHGGSEESEGAPQDEPHAGEPEQGDSDRPANEPSRPRAEE